MTTMDSSLHPRAERGWQTGLRNLLSNEMNLRWGGRRWLSSALTWLAILNGFILLVAFANSQDPSYTPSKTMLEAVDVFATIGIIAASIGIVVGTQGVIIREKQLGTAAWVLSKPASRESFILAKWIAYSFSAVALSLLLPGVVFIIQSQLLWKMTPALIPFLEGWLVMVVQVQFYLALTLLLGTVFNTRGYVTGIGLGFLFGGLILRDFLPDWVTLILPWPLKDVAAGLALSRVLPAGWPIPVIASLLWSVIFIGIALWRFKREEF
jgi:ABC-2 type transport system permease protein